MSHLLIAVIALAMPGMVAGIIALGALHDRRRCSVPDCIVCRVTGKGGGDR